MSFVLRYAARSDRGLVRGNNEDSVYAGARLLAVADGMGGHVGGEIASSIAIATLAPLDEDVPNDDLTGVLVRATQAANEGIDKRIEEEPALAGMGTTLTAILFGGRRIGLAHVGDSRGYLLRDGELIQITRDDTLVQAMVDDNMLTEEEAREHPKRSLILRALTGHPVEATVSVRETRVGDRYLLCSDGLTDYVSPDTVHETLAQYAPNECVDRLIDLALRAGSSDNVTCVVADVVDAPYGDDVPIIDGAVGENRGQRDTPDSPAARAAAADQARADATQTIPIPDTTDPAPEVMASPPKRRHRLRTSLVLGAAVLVLLIAGFSVWRWTQTQYFVAVDDGRVTVFRGLNTSLGPIRFYRVDFPTDLRVEDLRQAARDQVQASIKADDADDVDRILSALRDERMPICSPMIGSLPGDPATDPAGSRSSAPAPGGHTKPGSPTPGSAPPSEPAVNDATDRASSGTELVGPPIPGRDCRPVS